MRLKPQAEGWAGKWEMWGRMGPLQPGDRCRKRAGLGKGPGSTDLRGRGRGEAPEGDGEGKGTFREEEELEVSGVRGARRRLWPDTSEASEMGWKMCSSVVTSGHW